MFFPPSGPYPHFFFHYYYCHLVAFPDIRRIESPIPPFLIEWKIKVTRSMRNIASRDHTLHPRLYLILFHFFFFWADLFLFIYYHHLFFFLENNPFFSLSLYYCYVCVILAGPLSRPSYHDPTSYYSSLLEQDVFLFYSFSLRCASWWSASIKKSI